MPPSTPSPEPTRPLPPEQGECCRGDCGEGCVFSVYERELETWQAQQSALMHPPEA